MFHKFKITTISGVLPGRQQPGYNLLMIGPPGPGKTMLARRLPTIIPPLTLEEAFETTKIHLVAGRIDDHTALVTKRPFRSPHHTISDIMFINYVAN